MSDILSATFAGLLTEARADGADLVKWGGDAVLLLFQGPDHALRAARVGLPDAGDAAHDRPAADHVGRRSTLRMSVGIHSGDFDFFLVGDPEIHRELLISGPGASVTRGRRGRGRGRADRPERRDGRAAAAAAARAHPLRDGRLLRSQPVLDDVRGPAAPSVAGIDPPDVLPPPIRRAPARRDRSSPSTAPITVAFVQFSGTDELLAARGAGRAGRGAGRRRAQRAARLRRPRRHLLRDRHQPRRRQDHAHRRGAAQRRTTTRSGCCASPASSSTAPGRLPLRIGINRGHVFSGDFGPAFRRTYSVKGDAINLAARVMGKARPGRLLATLEVRRARRRRCSAPPSCRRSWSRASRSRSARPRSASSSAAAAEERQDVPLVGRDAGDGRPARGPGRRRGPAHGRLVEVVGEPGIGKSRLVDGAAGRRRRRAGGCGPVRGVRVVDGVLPVPPAAARGARARGRTPTPTRRGRPARSSVVDRARAAPGRRGCRCSACRWTSQLPADPGDRRAGRAVPQGPARGGRDRAPVPGAAHRRRSS